MSLVTFGNQTYSLDEYGFGEHPGLWDEMFAEGIAPQIAIGTGLGERHWQIIRYLRLKLEQEHTVPFFVMACMDNGLKIAEFRQLFPTGYMRGACRAAGLPLIP